MKKKEFVKIFFELHGKNPGATVHYLLKSFIHNIKRMYIYPQKQVFNEKNLTRRHVCDLDALNKTPKINDRHRHH